MSDAKTNDDKTKQADAKTNDDDHLVVLTKGGETLRVHPTTVAAHIRAGWQVA